MKVGSLVICIHPDWVVYSENYGRPMPKFNKVYTVSELLEKNGKMYIAVIELGEKNYSDSGGFREILPMDIKELMEETVLIESF